MSKISVFESKSPHKREVDIKKWGWQCEILSSISFVHNNKGSFFFLDLHFWYHSTENREHQGWLESKIGKYINLFGKVRFFKKTVARIVFLSKLWYFLICIESTYHNFERNVIRTNVFLKWTDFILDPIFIKIRAKAIWKLVFNGSSIMIKMRLTKNILRWLCPKN